MATVLADRVKETTTTTGTGSITLAGASAGYQAFSAVGDTNTTYYCITNGTAWEVGLGTYSTVGPTLTRDTVLSSSNAGALVSFAAGSKDVFCVYPAAQASAAHPAGLTGAVQFNNAGVFGSADNVIIDAGDITLLEETAPTSPATGRVKIFGRSISGRMFPAFVGPNGVDTSIQPLLARNKVAYWAGATGSTTSAGFGIALTATGTATAATWAATNLANSINRLDYRVTTANASAVCGFRGGGNNYWRGNAANLGGFTYVCRWGIGGLGTNLAAMRAFVGLRSSTAAATDVAPNTLTNSIGMGWESADTTLQIYSAGSANTKINTGIAFSRTLQAQVFELVMFCPPNASFITYTVNEVNTANTFTTTITTSTPTALPANNIALNVYGYMSAGGTSTTLALALGSVYVETDT